MEMETPIAMGAREGGVEFSPLIPRGGRANSFQTEALKLQKYLGCRAIEEGFGGFWIDAN